MWADVLCPWCYIGEQRLATAVAQSAHAGEIDLKIHTFQLDPTAPTTVGPTLEYLSTKYGVPRRRPVPSRKGWPSRRPLRACDTKVDRPVSNTHDMLRLVHLGAEHGVGWQ